MDRYTQAQMSVEPVGNEPDATSPDQSSNRVKRGFGAGAYGQVVTVGISGFGVWALRRLWGWNRYSDWAVLSSIPAFLLSVADMGYGIVTASEMSKLVGEGDQKAALRVFQSSLAVLTVVMVVLAPCLVLAVPYMHIDKNLNLVEIDFNTATTALTILLMAVLLSQVGGFFQAAYQTVHHYARFSYTYHTFRLIELVMILTMALWTKNIVLIALGMLVLKAVSYCYYVLDLRRLCGWIKFGYGLANMKDVVRLLGPAVTSNLFTLAQALSIQGISAMVSSGTDSTIATLFLTTRTMARVPFQFSQQAGFAAQPEYSKYFGANRSDLARDLFQKVMRNAFWIYVVLASGIVLLGRPAYHVWTGKDVSIPLVLIFLFSGIGTLLWGGSSTLLISANRHQRIAMVYVVLTAVCFFAARPVAAHFGIVGVGALICVTEFAAVLLIMPPCLASVGESVGDLLRHMAQPAPFLRRMLRWGRS